MLLELGAHAAATPRTVAEAAALTGCRAGPGLLVGRQPCRSSHHPHTARPFTGPQKSIALPDVHSGYGFAIGNVAAFDMADPQAVVSPGGVGFDIKWV